MIFRFLNLKRTVVYMRSIYILIFSSYFSKVKYNIRSSSTLFPESSNYWIYFNYIFTGLNGLILCVRMSFVTRVNNKCPFQTDSIVLECFINILSPGACLNSVVKTFISDRYEKEWIFPWNYISAWNANKTNVLKFA